MIEYIIPARAARPELGRVALKTVAFRRMDGLLQCRDSRHIQTKASLGKHIVATNICDLRAAPHWISTIAQWQFEFWGLLTGFDTLGGYVQLLTGASKSDALPRVLIAEEDGNLLGSVNLVACDCTVRSDLTPWLAQLFIAPEHRKLGIGAALVRAAQDSARELGFQTLHLFTSGTLPNYYRSLGWSEIETFSYHGRERTLMAYDLRR
jgi:N-acetylglutamate synthase-like GNAT family acetyltransferase